METLFANPQPAQDVPFISAPQKPPTKRSSICTPVLVTWSLAERMAGARRCEVVKAAIAAGVAENTARTQYQAWYKWCKAGRPTK